jgi:hypothetical protein
MIRVVLIISTLVLLYSCKESTPSGVINPKKMQEILWDILRADALSQQIVKNDSSKSLIDEKNKLSNKIFLIHNITEEQFKESYSYYVQHPDILQTMLDSLNAQQSRKINYETHPPYKNMSDSVK